MQLLGIIASTQMQYSPVIDYLKLRDSHELTEVGSEDLSYDARVLIHCQNRLTGLAPPPSLVF